ncbi:MAG: threonine-phosphate decarboxylase [Candidatus Omnitrophica bacterium]|nr:threonine-phosphate decarboxylase [Candidatus Omnitrophota bacterium]
MANLRFLHGGNIYEAERQHKKRIFDFSANINPHGLPRRIKATIHKNLDRILHYPDPEAKELTKKIAHYWNISPENVLVGCGSIELIYLLMAEYRPKTVLIPQPTFSEYERAARSVKSRVRFLNLKEKEGFKLDVSQISGTDTLFLCNPNNPTGNLIINDRKRLRKLPGKLIVVDEAFMDFVPEEKRHTLIHVAKTNKKIIVLRTFTKFFALPGLRVGYLIAHKDVIKLLRRRQMPWSVNALAQLATTMMLDDIKYAKKTQRLIEHQRAFLFAELTRINGVSPYSSAANFLLIKIQKKNVTSSALQKRLLKKGVLVRDCANFRGLNNKFIRIAVRSRKENCKFIDALRKAI